MNNPGHPGLNRKKRLIKGVLQAGKLHMFCVYHRITDYSVLKGTHKVHPFQLCREWPIQGPSPAVSPRFWPTEPVWFYIEKQNSTDKFACIKCNPTRLLVHILEKLHCIERKLWLEFHKEHAKQKRLLCTPMLPGIEPLHCFLMLFWESCSILGDWNKYWNKEHKLESNLKKSRPRLKCYPVLETNKNLALMWFGACNSWKMPSPRRIVQDPVKLYYVPIGTYSLSLFLFSEAQ